MPLFQNESKCKTIHMKMSSAGRFIFMQISHFALRLALKQRQLGNGLLLISCMGGGGAKYVRRDDFDQVRAFYFYRKTLTRGTDI